MGFMFDEPFVSNSSETDDLLEKDHEIIKDIKILITKFAAYENMIVNVKSVENRIEKNTLKLLPGELEGWKWKTITEDFRSFSYKKNLDSYIETLKNSSENILNKIINLHFRLCSSYEGRIINILINRIYKAISIVPYVSLESFENDEEVLSWEDIHRQYPWLWVCILIQNVLKDEIYQIDKA